MAFVSSHRSEEWTSEIMLAPGCAEWQCNVNCHMKISISVPHGSKLSHHLFKYILMVTRERRETIFVDIFTIIINNETIQQRLDMATAGMVGQDVLGGTVWPSSVKTSCPATRAPPNPGNSTKVAAQGISSVEGRDFQPTSASSRASTRSSQAARSRRPSSRRICASIPSPPRPGSR